MTVTGEVDAYREQIIAWLARKEHKWRETARVGTGAASDAASFYAAAYSNAIQGILDREPERRAAMKELGVKDETEFTTKEDRP